MTSFGSAPSSNSTIECRKSGGYLEINGSIEQELVEDDTEIVVCVSDADRTNMKTYKPFYTLTEDGNGNGYSMYLNYAELPSDLCFKIIPVFQCSMLSRLSYHKNSEKTV